ATVPSALPSKLLTAAGGTLKRIVVAGDCVEPRPPRKAYEPFTASAHGEDQGSHSVLNEIVGELPVDAALALPVHKVWSVPLGSVTTRLTVLPLRLALLS